MILKKFSPVRAFLILVCLAFFSVSAHAETLEEAVLSALKFHPTVEAIRAQVKAEEEGRREQFSRLFPELTLSGKGGRMFGDNSTSRGLSVTRGAGYSYLWEGTVSARQPIFNGFETYNRIDSAEARESAAEMDLLDARESLAQRAVQAYTNVLRQDISLKMLRAQRARIQDYLQRIKNAVDQGAADEAEYQQALDIQVAIDDFIADYEGQFEVAQADFVEVTGRMPVGSLQPPGNPGAPKYRTVEEAVSFAKENYPAVLAAVYTAEAGESDVKAEWGTLFPDVDAELSYLKSDKEDILGGEAVDARAVMRLNWAFEAGGGQLARIKKKKHEHRQAMARVDELRRQVERAVRLAYAELDTAQERYGNSMQRKQLNAQLLQTYGAQFEGARVTLLQLMQIDNQAFNAELEVVNAHYRVVDAQYGLLSALGKLQTTLGLQGVGEGEDFGKVVKVMAEPTPKKAVPIISAKESPSKVEVKNLQGKEGSAQSPEKNKAKGKTYAPLTGYE